MERIVVVLNITLLPCSQVFFIIFIFMCDILRPGQIFNIFLNFYFFRISICQYLFKFLIFIIINKLRVEAYLLKKKSQHEILHCFCFFFFIKQSFLYFFFLYERDFQPEAFFIFINELFPRCLSQSYFIMSDFTVLNITLIPCLKANGVVSFFLYLYLRKFWPWTTTFFIYFPIFIFIDEMLSWEELFLNFILFSCLEAKKSCFYIIFLALSQFFLYFFYLFQCSALSQFMKNNDLSLNITLFPCQKCQKAKHSFLFFIIFIYGQIYRFFSCFPKLDNETKCSQTSLFRYSSKRRIFVSCVFRKGIRSQISKQNFPRLY